LKIVAKLKNKEFGECMMCHQRKRSKWFTWYNIYFPDRPKINLNKICYKCAESVVGKKNKNVKELLGAK
jgi:hypothetical protein